MGGYQEVVEGQIVMKMQVIAFPTEKGFQRFSHLPLPVTDEDTLTNGNFPYKYKYLL